MSQKPIKMYKIYISILLGYCALSLGICWRFQVGSEPGGQSVCNALTTNLDAPTS